MAKSSNPRSRIRTIIAKTTLIGGLTTLAALAVAPVASASGTSPKTNGCYSTWGSTGTNGHCYPVTVTGNFQVHAVCDYESDGSSSWSYFYKNANIGGFGQYNCTFHISRSWINYSG